MKNAITRSIGFYLNTLAVVAPRKAGKASFNLFCHPFRPKLSERQLKFLHSAEQFTFAHAGETIQAYRWGKGTHKILFLHGWQSHSYRWKKFVETFDPREYTLYAFDAPGHGLSGGGTLTVPLYSEAIRQMLDRIGGADTIITHSLGGFSALYTFHHEPLLQPSRMLLMAPPGEAQEFFDFYQRQLGLSDKTIAETERRFRELFKAGPEHFSAPRFAAAMTIPGLLIHDEQDEETHADNSRRIHENWKGSQLVITSGLGHNLKSPEIVRLATDFVTNPQLQLSPSAQPI